MGATDINIYQLFYAITIVLSLVSYIYTMEGLGNMEWTAIIADVATKTSEKFVGSIFGSIANIA